MTKIPKYWNKAKRYLSKKDKTISKLIKKYKSPSEIILTSRKDIFFSLCKSIIGQQISVAAANSVFLRFISVFSAHSLELLYCPMFHRATALKVDCIGNSDFCSVCRNSLSHSFFSVRYL